MNKRMPYNLGVALGKAQKDFASADPVKMSLKSGVPYNEEKKEFELTFLNENYIISYPAGEVTTKEGGGKAGIVFDILFLHYIYLSQGVPLSNEWISFKELPGGQIYIAPFQNRAIKPFTTNFGTKSKDFSKAAENLGGETKDFGDLSYALPVFPRVPIMFVLWEADEEFPASGTILFDSSAGSYLDTEDYAMLCGLLVGKLQGAVK